MAHVADARMLAIIGAGPGLGSALARRFAQTGWSIALDAAMATLESAVGLQFVIN